MAINRVDITVQNLAALSLVLLSELEDGALAWVISDSSYYVLIKNSGAPPTGTTVIAPAPGSPSAGNAGARWFFLESGGDEQAATQPVWFIDPVGGSDEADGKTALTPIKTEQEAVRRIGTQIVNVAMVWNLMNDFPLDNPFYVPPSFQIGNTGSLSIVRQRALTQLAAGTLTAATAISRAAGGGNSQQITDAAQNWTAVGAINTTLGAMVRVRLTANGAIAYGWKETVLGTLFTSPFYIPAAAIGQAFVQFTPVGNEAYVVETGFIQIADFRVTPSGNAIVTIGPRLFAFEIGLPNIIGPPPPAINAQGAVVGFTQATPGLGATEVLFSACDTGRLTPFSCLLSEAACKQSGVSRVINEGLISFRGCLSFQALNLQGGLANSAIFGDQTFVKDGRIFVYASGLDFERVAVFDTSIANSDGITIFPGGSVRAFPVLNTEAIYGNGIVRAGISAQGGGQLFYSTVKPTITGAAADVRMNGVNIGVAGAGYAKIPFYDVRNDFIHAGIIGALTGAVTRFVFPNYTQSASDDIGWIASEPSVVRNLRVRSRTAAGAGGDVYTVFLNGVATTVTATMAAGGTTATDLNNSFVAAAGDKISFQIVEGAAGAADVQIVLEVLATNSPGDAIVQGG